MKVDKKLKKQYHKPTFRKEKIRVFTKRGMEVDYPLGFLTSEKN